MRANIQLRNVKLLMIMPAKDLNAMNGFEKVFITFAAAFALEEYTASKEHGWTSKSYIRTLLRRALNVLTYFLVYIANVRGQYTIPKVY